MKFKPLFIAALLLLASASLRAQNVLPIRDFNAGISAGVGGLHWLGMPSLDLSYKTLTLRTVPYLPRFSAGLQYGFLRMPFKQKNLGYFIVSANYTRNDDDYKTEIWNDSRDWQGFDLLTGAQFLFLKRMYANVQFGLAHRRFAATQQIFFEPEAYNNTEFIIELGLGIRLFRNLNDQ